MANEPIWSRVYKKESVYRMGRSFLIMGHPVGIGRASMVFGHLVRRENGGLQKMTNCEVMPRSDFFTAEKVAHTEVA